MEILWIKRKRIMRKMTWKTKMTERMITPAALGRAKGDLGLALGSERTRIFGALRVPIIPPSRGSYLVQISLCHPKWARRSDVASRSTRRRDGTRELTMEEPIRI
jgi:hypothetical protein